MAVCGQAVVSTVSEKPQHDALTAAAPIRYWPYGATTEDPPANVRDTLLFIDGMLWGSKLHMMFHLDDPTGTGWVNGETVKITGYRPDDHPVVIALSVAGVAEVREDGGFKYFKFEVFGGVAATNITHKVIAHNEGDRFQG